MVLNKKEIVSKFLERGLMLDAAAVKYFMENNESVGVFLDKIEGDSTPPTITTEYVQSVMGEAPETTSHPQITSVGVLRRMNKKKRVGVSGFVSLYNDRYENMKDILLKKMSAQKVTSINKSPKRGEVALIVMIREKDMNEKALLVEDPTGWVSVGVSDRIIEGVLEDDVVGLVCEVSTDGINAKEIVWPDIPLRRDLNKTNKTTHCLFISGMTPNPENTNKHSYKKFIKWLKTSRPEKLHIFILDNVSGTKKKLEMMLNSTTQNNFHIFTGAGGAEFLKSGVVQFDFAGVNFLVVGDDIMKKFAERWPNTDRTKAATNTLKRRLVEADENNMVLASVPDIFISTSQNSPTHSNYKGTTIILTGSFLAEPVFWTIDLKTREINKVDFS